MKNNKISNIDINEIIIKYKERVIAVATILLTIFIILIFWEGSEDIPELTSGRSLNISSKLSNPWLFFEEKVEQKDVNNFVCKSYLKKQEEKVENIIVEDAVKIINKPPVIDIFEISLARTRETKRVFLNYKTSDEDGEISNIEINWGDNKVENFKQTEGKLDHTFAEQGVYTITISVCDNKNEIVTQSKEIKVLENAKVVKNENEESAKFKFIGLINNQARITIILENDDVVRRVISVGDVVYGIKVKDIKPRELILEDLSGTSHRVRLKSNKAVTIPITKE